MTNLPKIALGAWAWGNDGTFGGDITAESLRPIFDTAMANGLNLWDTAYAYGMGTSEKVLAGFLKGLERVADSLELNVIRFWEKEMK
jgi:aryl-alcohol dehydrogenase-like predicted oxidoreductase